MSADGDNNHNNNSNEALRRMTKLVNSLMARADCGPFLEPVDWRGLELYDYPQVVKKMMDLGTVKRKLLRKQYKTAHECATDIRLIWKNCLSYNMEGSDFWLLAKSFSRRFEDRYKKIKAECEFWWWIKRKSVLVNSVSMSDLYCWNSSHTLSRCVFCYIVDVGEDLAERSDEAASGSSTKKTSASSEHKTPASLDLKVQFSSNLFLLSGMEFGHVMSQIELKSPHALEELGGERMEINVNAMDNNLLLELDAYVKEKVGSRHASSAGEGHLNHASRPHKKRKK